MRLSSSLSRSVGLLAMVLFGVLAIRPASADIIPPGGRGRAAPPSPAVERPAPPAQVPAMAISAPAPFVIRHDAQQATSRIIIPRNLLPATPVRAAAPAVTENDSAGRDYRAVGMGLMLASVIAGGGLAVAFARRRKAGAATLLSIGLLVSLLLVGTALADIIPPGGRPYRRPVPPAPIKGPAIVVETVDSGDQVILILGKDATPSPAK